MGTQDVLMCRLANKHQGEIMAISTERFNDRIEFIGAFLELNAAIRLIAIKANISNDTDVIELLKTLNTRADLMMRRIEDDRK